MPANNNLKTSHSERVKRGIARAKLKQPKRVYEIKAWAVFEDGEIDQIFYERVFALCEIAERRVRYEIIWKKKCQRKYKVVPVLITLLSPKKKTKRSKSK